MVKVGDLESLEEAYDGSIVAIGNLKIKEKIYRRLKNPVSLIHASTMVNKTAIIGNGCVIEALPVVNSESIIKDGSFVCAGGIVNHNSVVGEFCQIDCNSVVAMGAEIPRGYIEESCSVFKKIEMAREHENNSFI